MSVFVKQKLTCGNHTDEEVVLDQIGWNSFNCPKCGSDYSIGRKGGGFRSKACTKISFFYRPQ